MRSDLYVQPAMDGIDFGMYTLRMRAAIFSFLILVCWCNYLTALLLSPQSFGWGRFGHQMINQTANSALPSDVPAFLRNGGARDAFGYYAPEPDRWGLVYRT